MSENLKFGLRVSGCLVLCILLLAGCQEAPEMPAPAVETPSPLALAETSPLEPEVAAEPAHLPDDIHRPPQPLLMFYSTRGETPGWYMMSPDGSEVQPIPFANIPGYRINALIWEPGLGVFLARLTTEQNESDYYLLDFEGKILSQVTTDPYEEGEADYSPAAGFFAYVCLRGDLDICRVTPFGQDFMNLTDSVAREASPQWSPDGNRILFNSNSSGIANIWVMAPDGSNRQNLSQSSLGGTLYPESEASWSPDGQLILFQSLRDENAEIYVMNSDGSNPRNLTQHPASDSSPKWSPDGRWIVFRSDRDGGTDIYVMELENPQPVNVTNTPDSPETNFIWSLDGSQIIFNDESSGSYDIYVVNRDGSGRTNLTDHPAHDVDPQWIGY